MRTRSKWRFCVFWHVCQKTLGDSLLKNDHFFTKRKKCQKWLICKKCKNDITLGVTHVFALFEKCQKRHFRDFGIFAKKCPRNCLIKKWPFCKNGKKRQKPCFWKVSKIDTFGHFLTCHKMTCHMSKLMILAKSGCHGFGSILDTHVFQYLQITSGNYVFFEHVP